MVELNPVKQESYQYSTLVFLDVTKTYQPLAKRNQVFASLSVGGGGLGVSFLDRISLRMGISGSTTSTREIATNN